VIVEHAQAVIALIDAVANVTIYGSELEPVPAKPTYPYVVVYANQGLPENASMSDRSDWVHVGFQTTCVAQSQAQARALADRVQPALLDVRPTVTGRTCGQISKTSSQRVRPDLDINPPVFYAVDTWTFLSVPA